MLKTKMNAIVVARVVLLLFFTILLPVFLSVYVVCLIGEWFLNFYSTYVTEFKQLLATFDEQLKKKV